MFSIANGNHILRYTENEYIHYLEDHPEALCKMLLLYHISYNWGYDDPRMFENYDEQWLAEKVDSAFKSKLDFSLSDFDYDNVLPYQKVVLDFTKRLINEAEDINNSLFKSASSLESIYVVLANNIEVDAQNQEIRNAETAIHRALEMYWHLNSSDYTPTKPFENWELVIY